MAETSGDEKSCFQPEIDGPLEVSTKLAARGDDASTIQNTNFALLGLSPHVSSETAHDDQHEYSSFSLLNASFDTISDTGLGLASDEIIQTSFGSTDRVVFTARGNKSDMEIPDLKHHGDDYSLGDISPIKMEYRSIKSSNKPDISNEQPPPISYESYHKPLTVIPGDWQAEGKYHLARSNPYFVIRSNRRVFESFKYKLSCLWAVDNYVNVSQYGGIRQYREREAPTEEIQIAIRRIEAAVCAFGGNFSATNNANIWSIFRVKEKSSCDSRRNYEHRLPSRFFVGGSRISWEVEQEPPIQCETREPGSADRNQKRKLSSRVNDGADDNSASSKSSCENSRQAFDVSTQDESKMKYRCKLCGQLKQNHNCPFQQSFQRSIGAMVYPAVNAYSAAEPGVLAPSATKMNNTFVSFDSDNGSPCAPYQHSSSHATAPIQKPADVPFSVLPSTITPEVARFHSPQSSLSAQSSEDQMSGYPSSAAGNLTADLRGIKRPHQKCLAHPTPGSTDVQQQGRVPFVRSDALIPEQFRAVTPLSKEKGKKPPYQYPPIPLTFAERKRLSDTLFCLSKEIPYMMNECANILRVARGNNDWDLAVAELLTQIVVGLYCSEGDVRLEGLQKYLLALGISC